MHVCVGGKPAFADRSTAVWQYRQSMPSSPTWCLWLNGTGCSRATFCPVLYEDRQSASRPNSPPPAASARPTTLTLARTLVYERKTCDMESPGYYERRLRV